MFLILLIALAPVKTTWGLCPGEIPGIRQRGFYRTFPYAEEGRRAAATNLHREWFTYPPPVQLLTTLLALHIAYTCGLDQAATCFALVLIRHMQSG